MFNDYDDFLADMNVSLDEDFENCLYLSEQLTEDKKAQRFYREESRRLLKKILERDYAASFA
jgi:hypothetical protein